MYQDDEFLLLSGIQHFSFCRRQWALIHIEQQWQENIHTVEGAIMHENAHENKTEKRGHIIITRSLPVVSREMGIRGVCDVVEFHEDDNGVEISGFKGKFFPIPIEYKKGKPKEDMSDILQLCAQAICLEEMLVCNIDKGYMFYGETRRRLVVDFDKELRATVKNMFDEMHQYFNRGYTPKSKPSKACKSCSLADICLPKIVKCKSVSKYVSELIDIKGEVL